MRTNTSILLSSLLTMGLAAGCLADGTIKEASVDGPPASNPSDEPNEPAAPTEPVSSTARVNFKGGARYASLLATGLGLETTEVCQELGRYDCAESVHRITLGGTDPYGLGVMKPVDELGVTAPLASERVALSACIKRVERDLGGNSANAKIFGSSKDASIRTLYQSILLRSPEPHEIEALMSLDADIIANNEPEPERSWAIASCLAVATTMEALFY